MRAKVGSQSPLAIPSAATGRATAAANAAPHRSSSTSIAATPQRVDVTRGAAALDTTRH
jgi:hypothetical protein